VTSCRAGRNGDISAELNKVPSTYRWC